jgi:hypothetical protein
VLLEERDRLLERIANEGPRAALQWARDESMARAARGEPLPEYCERLLSEPSSSDHDEDERKSKKRRVASPGHCARKLEPVSFIVPLGESRRWCFWVWVPEVGKVAGVCDSLGAQLSVINVHKQRKF